MEDCDKCKRLLRLRQLADPRNEGDFIKIGMMFEMRLNVFFEMFYN